MKLTTFARCLLVCGLVVGFASLAHACPTCGEGMNEAGEAGRKMINSWFWSIIFMMSMPFTILASLGSYMYWLVRKDRQAKAAAHAASLSAADPAHTLAT